MGKVVAFPRRGMISTLSVPTNENLAPVRDQRIEWTELLNRIQAGDHSALAELYDATSKAVFSLALRIVSERDIAEDVVVEVYSQVWGNAKAYNPQRGTALAWVLTMTRSRAIDVLRSRRHLQNNESIEEAHNLQADVPTPEDMSEAAEQQRLVQRALNGLSVDQRQLIELAYFSDLSHSEIAARVGQPLGTVKTRIRLGMLRLRQLLTQPLEAVAELNRQQIL
jgi:RNA polymerase sigma-70 factor, ECF subfamily